MMPRPDYDQNVLNQICIEMCQKCHYKYWEACTGAHIEWGIITCKKARERYEQLKGD